MTAVPLARQANTGMVDRSMGRVIEQASIFKTDCTIQTALKKDSKYLGFNSVL